jgi:hypothetical protein
MKDCQVQTGWTGRLLLPGVALLCLLAYLPGFQGYFLSDDFPNLHTAYILLEEGRFWHQLGLWFVSGVTEQGSFYRPLIVASMSLNYLIAGTWFPAWYAVNLATHLASMLLVFCIVDRLCWRCLDQPRPLAAAFAALLFGLCPLIVEGVLWPSARSDASVTLFALLALTLWLGSARSAPRPWWLPVLLLPALWFKESAVLIPLQFSLLWLVLPELRRRSHTLSLGLAWLLALAFLLFRAWLFDNPLQPYADPGMGSALPGIDTFGTIFASLPLWWQAYFSPSAWPGLVLLGAAAALLSLVLIAGRHRLVTLALLSASAGLVAATLINLGAMPPNGEGGRHWYIASAWLALGLGFGLASVGGRVPQRIAGLFALLLIGVSLPAHYQAVARTLEVQGQLKRTVAAIAEWSEARSGEALLLVPDRLGPIIMARNAQGAMVLRPIQEEGMIHRVLPTLPAELESRHGLYQAGILDIFDGVRMQYWDEQALAAYQGPTEPRFPASVLCWSQRQASLVEFPMPQADEASDWARQIRVGAGQAGCRLE